MTALAARDRVLVGLVALFVAAVIAAVYGFQVEATQPRSPRGALEACVVECRDREIGSEIDRMEIRHLGPDRGFVCVCRVRREGCDE